MTISEPVSRAISQQPTIASIACSDAGVRITERAELVILVLERVRIDASDPDPALSGECRQAGEIVDRIPGDMERDRLCDPGVAGDRGRVFDLLEGVARYPGLREAKGHGLHEFVTFSFGRG